MATAPFFPSGGSGRVFGPGGIGISCDHLSVDMDRINRYRASCDEDEYQELNRLLSDQNNQTCHDRLLLQDKRRALQDAYDRCIMQMNSAKYVINPVGKQNPLLRQFTQNIGMLYTTVNHLPLFQVQITREMLDIWKIDWPWMDWICPQQSLYNMGLMSQQAAETIHTEQGVRAHKSVGSVPTTGKVLSEFLRSEKGSTQSFLYSLRAISCIGGTFNLDQMIQYITSLVNQRGTTVKEFYAPFFPTLSDLRNNLLTKLQNEHITVIGCLDGTTPAPHSGHFFNVYKREVPDPISGQMTPTLFVFDRQVHNVLSPLGENFNDYFRARPAYFAVPTAGAYCFYQSENIHMINSPARKIKKSPLRRHKSPLRRRKSPLRRRKSPKSPLRSRKVRKSPLRRRK